MIMIGLAALPACVDTDPAPEVTLTTQEIRRQPGEMIEIHDWDPRRPDPWWFNLPDRRQTYGDQYGDRGDPRGWHIGGGLRPKHILFIKDDCRWDL
jgi:hypothetical protein